MIGFVGNVIEKMSKKLLLKRIIAEIYLKEEEKLSDDKIDELCDEIWDFDLVVEACLETELKLKNLDKKLEVKMREE